MRVAPGLFLSKFLLQQTHANASGRNRPARQQRAQRSIHQPWPGTPGQFPRVAMTIPSLHHRLAVCSWSLQPASPQQLIEYLQNVGIPRVQLALDPLRDNPAVWDSLPDLFQEHAITIVSGMFGTIGEDYSTLESIRRTGGIVPDEHWEQNWRNIQSIAEIARSMDLSLVTFHAGFLPHDDSDPTFAKLLDRISQIADCFEERHIILTFETGQETAEGLRDFLVKLNRPTVGVNFDPANIILYDNGDPIQALRTLGPWVRQVHLKDANRTRVPGTWGDEVVLGTGQVDWPAFFRILDELEFDGYLGIEREAGDQRVEDIRTAREFIEQLLEAR
jgi:L-ribulose-5-phosphate 3-epimerase